MGGERGGRVSESSKRGGEGREIIHWKQDKQ